MYGTILQKLTLFNYRNFLWQIVRIIAVSKLYSDTEPLVYELQLLNRKSISLQLKILCKIG